MHFSFVLKGKTVFLHFIFLIIRFFWCYRFIILDNSEDNIIDVLLFCLKSFMLRQVNRSPFASCVFVCLFVLGWVAFGSIESWLLQYNRIAHQNVIFLNLSCSTCSCNCSVVSISYVGSWYSLVVDADVRLARRIRRDTVERGRDLDSVLEQVRLFIWYLQLIYSIILVNFLVRTYW